MQERFEQLREGFRQRLPERWREVAQAEGAEQLGATLHRLAGAAGSYGFEGVYAAARVAQDALCGRGPSLSEALGGLRAAIDEAVGAGAPSA